jgi:N-acetyl-anhydromuramyl-L-alanine amidase AmpD
MAVHWLTDLADVLRKAGLKVQETDGWKTRSFPNWPGYEAGAPTHVMVHHTASKPATDGAADVNYIINAKPWGGVICNLYLDRKGQWWVIAAGRSATNGGGVDTWGGGVPKDLMNFYAIGIEAANDGAGEAWPKVQTDSYVKGVAALCKAYHIPVAHVRAHAEWSPGRKIDPAGPSPWAASGTWNMNAFRNSVTVALGQQPSPNQQPSPAPVKPPPPFNPAAGQFGLYPLDSHKATIKLNSNGDLVRYLQGVLKRKGANVVVDGFFGPATDALVKAYQVRHGLKADGIVGAAETWPKIDYDATH